jgi:hypothetical protein
MSIIRARIFPSLPSLLYISMTTASLKRPRPADCRPRLKTHLTVLPDLLAITAASIAAWGWSLTPNPALTGG